MPHAWGGRTARARPHPPHKANVFAHGGRVLEAQSDLPILVILLLRHLPLALGFLAIRLYHRAELPEGWRHNSPGVIIWSAWA